MSFGSKANVPSPEPDKAGLEDQQVSSSQEATPIPVLAGERKLAVKWISRVYNQKAVEAPVERPGKK